MSLYLQYRPQTFADITGQDHIVQTLEQAVKQDKLAHAYLFTGSRGTGKTSTARILAKKIMTKTIADEVIAKQIIDGIENGSLVDLIEIDGASNRNIDDIRSLKEQIQFSPVVASAKVYIIDEVHMFTKEAFNALLKTLEEPPKYAFFILATTELHKIPATIQSRCQTFPFKKIGEQDIISRLQFIADTEKISIEREAIRAIAHHVQGGMRDAISLLDQLQSLEKITVADVHKRTGNIGIEHLESMWNAITQHNQAAIVETIQELEQQGIPLDAFIRQLLVKAQSVLHEQISNNQATTTTQRLTGNLLQAIMHIRTAPLPSLALEHALLSITEPIATPQTTQPITEAAVTTSSSNPSNRKVTDAIQNETKVSTAQNTKVTAQSSTSATSDAPASSAAFTASEVTINDIKSIWLEITKTLQPASARMSLKDAQLLELKGNQLLLGFSSSFHKDKVSDPAAMRNLEETLQEKLRTKITVKCTEEVASHITPIADDELVNLADAANEVF